MGANLPLVKNWFLEANKKWTIKTTIKSGPKSLRWVYEETDFSEFVLEQHLKYWKNINKSYGTTKTSGFLRLT